MKLANRTASKVIEAMNKSMAASLQKEQAKSVTPSPVIFPPLQ